MPSLYKALELRVWAAHRWLIDKVSDGLRDRMATRIHHHAWPKGGQATRMSGEASTQFHLRVELPLQLLIRIVRRELKDGIQEVL